jgi:hypothetical protein
MIDYAKEFEDIIERAAKYNVFIPILPMFAIRCWACDCHMMYNELEYKPRCAICEIRGQTTSSGMK